MAVDFSRYLPDLTRPESDYECYVWIKESGLLLKKIVCESCNTPFDIRSSLLLRCDNLQCDKRLIEISRFDGSFFNPLNSFLTLPIWLHLINGWCIQKPIAQAVKELNIDIEYVLKVYGNCRNFCADFFKTFPVKLRQNIIHVRKHRLRFYFERCLVEFCFLLMVGKVEIESSVKSVGYFEKIVFNASNSDLVSVIENAVEPGYHVIVSDDFGKPPIVDSNKSLKFVNCGKYHEQILDSYFQAHFEIIKQIKKAKPENRESYLQECMWRDRAHGDLYECFINDLKQFYNSK